MICDLLAAFTYWSLIFTLAFLALLGGFTLLDWLLDGRD